MTKRNGHKWSLQSAEHFRDLRTELPLLSRHRYWLANFDSDLNCYFAVILTEIGRRVSRPIRYASTCEDLRIMRL
jgi:hypothetical protein